MLFVNKYSACLDGYGQSYGGVTYKSQLDICAALLFACMVATSLAIKNPAVNPPLFMHIEESHKHKQAVLSSKSHI